MVDNSLKEFISLQYNPQIGILLLRILNELDEVEDGADFSEIIAELPGFNNKIELSTATDKVREYIYTEGINSIGLFGITINPDSDIVHVEAIMRTLRMVPTTNDKENMICLLNTDDNVKSFVDLVEYATGTNAVRLYETVWEVLDTTIEGMLSILSEEYEASNGDTKIYGIINALTSLTGPNIGYVLTQLNTPVLMSVEYYLTLVELNQMNPELAGNDVYTLACLAYGIDQASDKVINIIDSNYSDHTPEFIRNIKHRANTLSDTVDKIIGEL